jgi:meso-butanediol dehydrogenase/(S,S)-butanediol dehydrogenase/diacetyl reductase
LTPSRLGRGRKAGERPLELANRVALVTGAARGIGRGVAIALAQAGCHVALADIADNEESREQLEETRREIEGLARQAVSFRTNVTDALDVRSLVAEAERVFGRIDVLVNNAGVISHAPVTELTVEEFRRVLDVNVLGTFLCCKTVAPGMVARGSGSIVNIASVAGKRGAPNLSHYVASKFAVIGFTQSLALELAAAGVRANTVCPGLVETDMRLAADSEAASAHSARERLEAFARSHVPLGRAQRPSDIGQAVVFLCQAQNITGESLVVAGGLVMD